MLRNEHSRSNDLTDWADFFAAKKRFFSIFFKFFFQYFFLRATMGLLANNIYTYIERENYRYR